MERLEAYVIKDELNIQNDRRRLLKTRDGRKFVAKNTLCPKISGERNPTWLVNEIVYWKFACLFEVRIPHAALLTVNHEEYFGSKFVPTRSRVCNSNELKQLTDRIPENLTQLTRALLLDLALLNSDRELWNVLLDAVDCRLWFIDHDKSLWGDGQTPPGDLGRIDLNILDQKFTDYIGDYLPSPEANALVWNKTNWPSVLQELKSLYFDIANFRAARADVPESWLTPLNWKRMEDFYPVSGISCIRSLMDHVL